MKQPYWDDEMWESTRGFTNEELIQLCAIQIAILRERGIVVGDTGMEFDDDGNHYWKFLGLGMLWSDGVYEDRKL